MIADLDSQQFAVRERACADLEKLGELAIPALLSVLAGNPSLEMRQRVERLLGQIEGPTHLPPRERLQVLRGIEALEWTGTAEARQILEKLAKGAEEAAPTREARAALLRLDRAARSVR